MIVYRELSSLTADLGVSARTLYGVSNDLDRHYRRVCISKRSGGERCLSVPDGLLRDIQRRITGVLLAHMPVSGHAMAYRFGGSTVRNAAPHVGKPLLLNLDIRDFFGSILYSNVKRTAFPAEIYAEPLRVLLSILCYYREALPQGAPSSPAISNIFLREFDDETAAWCAGRGIAYTRYCDDMAFSGEFDPGEVIESVRERLREMGLFLNDRKTRLAPAGQRQAVTGIVVNEKQSVPYEYRRRLRQELYYCRKYGVAEHLRHEGSGVPPGAYLETLYGRVNYVLQVMPDDREMWEYREWLKERLCVLW